MSKNHPKHKVQAVHIEQEKQQTPGGDGNKQNLGQWRVGQKDFVLKDAERAALKKRAGVVVEVEDFETQLRFFVT